MEIIKIRNVILTIVISISAWSASAQTVINYGTDELQFGELTIPDIEEGPFPVVVFLHGGCWKSSPRVMSSFRPMAHDVAFAGIAVWNMQFRGATSIGGGWPGTWLDISNGFNKLESLATEYSLDLDSIVVVGHSSGAHFAAWLAMRAQLPETSEIYSPSSLKPAGVILVDSHIYPEVMDSRGVDGSYYCDEPILGKLVGGPVDKNTERLHEISPLKWLPWGVPQEYIVGTSRYPVSLPRPLSNGRTTMTVPDYPALSVQAGDKINVQVLNEADHFDFVRSGTRPYQVTLDTIERVISELQEE